MINNKKNVDYIHSFKLNCISLLLLNKLMVNKLEGDVFALDMQNIHIYKVIR